DGGTAMRLAFILALLPAAIAALLLAGFPPAISIVTGLILFGIVFALNSAVHSYLILAYTDHDKVAMNVGVYYMANACGRLAGTILSGTLYQFGLRTGENGGLIWCLLASTLFLLSTGLLSLRLPQAKARQQD